ncbi:MAG: glycosyltransferase family 4 protein [Cyanobacteria bacterium J06626_26]
MLDSCYPLNLAVSQTSQRHILVITRTFLPAEGGIEEYVYSRCLQDPDKVILLTAGSCDTSFFDNQQPFLIYRWWLPGWLPSNAWGRILKQILNMVGAFMMALRLSARYSFCSIEWCHGYDFPAFLLLTYVLPVKTFIYLHGNDLLCPLKLPVIKSLFRLTLQRLEGVICNSSFTEQYLRSHLPTALNTYIINPTVRTTKFRSYALAGSSGGQQIRHRYGISNEATVLLSVGRLVKRKGFDRVIRNLPHLLAQGLDVHYIICGRGAMQAELESLVTTLGLAKHIHFAGFVPDQDLAQYYAACDVFTMLTTFEVNAGSIEGFGIVYAEAGYFSKPVLATNVGGVVDAVHHEKNGLLVAANDDDGIAHALVRLCRDPLLRERLGNMGRQLALKQTPHRLIYQG